MRFDRFICKHTEYSQKQARFLVASGRARLNGVVVTDGYQPVTRFCHVSLGDRVLQAREACYLMLNKPPGYLSATRDPDHATVMELISPELHAQLHIAGRLDRQTSGLLILTNDGHWSRLLTAPEQKVPKVYRVETLWPITADTVAVFEQGVYLATEGITTSPAKLEVLGRNEARLTIFEGRFHQVKRMFLHVDNMVTALHRESVGEIVLDEALAPGEYRSLTAAEIGGI